MIWPGRHQIGMVAAMRLEWVAAFVGIRNRSRHAAGNTIAAARGAVLLG
jgi:hypothetical protein